MLKKDKTEIDKDFGSWIKKIIKERKAGPQKDYATMIIKNDGEPVGETYLSQLLSGNTWPLNFICQILKGLGLKIAIDGDGFYPMTDEEVKHWKTLKSYKEFLKKHNLVEEKKQSGKKKKKTICKKCGGLIDKKDQKKTRQGKAIKI